MSPTPLIMFQSFGMLVDLKLRDHNAVAAMHKQAFERVSFAQSFWYPSLTRRFPGGSLSSAFLVPIGLSESFTPAVRPRQILLECLSTLPNLHVRRSENSKTDNSRCCRQASWVCQRRVASAPLAMPFILETEST